MRRSLPPTVMNFTSEPHELHKAQTEFKERTGGGIVESKWCAPLLPPDIEPPIDLPWPEYIHTNRGEEWWIPTTDEDR